MAEYIEREAVIEAVNLRCAETGHPTMFSLKNPLLSIPAADVRPVVHGRWFISRIDYSWNGTEFPTHLKCDQCGREIPFQDKEDFCPSCGADMREEKHGLQHSKYASC